MDRPHLRVLLLDKFARQVAASARIANAFGKGAYSGIFETSDLLLTNLQSELQKLNACDPPASSSDEVERWPSFAEALAEEMGTSDSGDGCGAPVVHVEPTVVPKNLDYKLPQKLTDAEIQFRIDDRWACIRPVIERDILEACGKHSHLLPSDADLRRNVAAHARGAGASLLVSQLSASQLRRAQKLGNSSELAARVGCS